jgi:hypothetical protein
MIPAYANKLPASKSSKNNRVLFTRAESSPVAAGILTIGTDRGATDYVLAETATEWAGRAFHVAKLDGSETYSVFCGSPEDTRCDCRGFERWGASGSLCKHILSIRQLIADGEL